MKLIKLATPHTAEMKYELEYDRMRNLLYYTSKQCILGNEVFQPDKLMN